MESEKRVVLRLSGRQSICYIVLFLLYIGLAFLFASFSPQSQVVSLWPPAGVALAGLILFGWRFLPAGFLASFFFNITAQLQQLDAWDMTAVLVAAGIAVGSTLQAGLNYFLLKAGKIDLLEAPSAQKAVRFILIAVLCCTIGALIGNGVLGLPYSSNGETGLAWHNVLIWWVGDLLGVLLITPIVLALFQRPPERYTRPLLLKNLALPLALIVGAFHFAQQYIEGVMVESAHSEFMLKAQVAENSLKRQVNRYLSALETLQDEIARQGDLSPEAFRTRAGQVLDELPGLKALSWNPLVEQADVSEFERAISTRLGSEFRVRGAPLTASDPLVVVQYIEPLSENRAAQGFNVFSNEARKRSLIQARNTRTPTATDIIQLVQSDKPEPGFLVFSPLFRNVNPDDRSMGSQQVLQGFAVGVFLVESIIEQGLSDELFNFINLYIYENGEPEDPVYGNQDILRQVALGEGLGYQFELIFANHRWDFNLAIGSGQVMALQIADSLGFLIAETVVGLLATFIVLSSFSRHQQLSQLVSVRTSELEEVNAQLEYYAFFDSLTGLPNRRLFVDRAQHALTLAERNGSELALLFMDLNRFKQVNDSLGHEVGDQMLHQVAKRFSHLLRDSDTLARVGGDEFTLLIENNPSREEVVSVVHKLQESLAQPLTVGGQQLATSISIGIALYPQDGANVAELLRGADAAMYKAKREGSGVCFYSEDLYTEASQQLFMAMELPQVIKRGELELYFQPIMSLDPKAHLGCECLLRWNHPVRGLIPPASFIPAAETTGEIVPIGYWVIEEACQKLVQWQREGLSVGKISFNVSARQLQHAYFADTVHEILQRTQAPAANLQLEVTESELMKNMEIALKALHQIKALGISIAIDDFGTGYSSLSYLKQMPLDVLKVDRSFVESMQAGSDGYAIVRSTLNLANDLGLEVIAEGVEREAQLAVLKKLHCNAVQGNLFSKPLREQGYLSYMRRHQ